MVLKTFMNKQLDPSTLPLHLGQEIRSWQSIQAIAADGSMTVAYLYKGGLFNRMERFGEALECYEKALHTQETKRG